VEYCFFDVITNTSENFTIESIQNSFTIDGVDYTLGELRKIIAESRAYNGIYT